MPTPTLFDSDRPGRPDGGSFVAVAGIQPGRPDPLESLPLPARHDQPVSIAAAVELQASGRDASQRDAIVAALRTGAKTNAKLGAIAPRFSARLCELRKLGYAIRTTAIGGGVFTYRLTEGAQ